MEPWRRALEGSRFDVAWDLFLDRYRRLIFSAIRHYAQDYDDVMDVFASVCETLREDNLRRLREYSQQPVHRARFSTWLVYRRASHHRRLAQDALREALGIYQRTGPISQELAVRRDLAGALAAAGDLQGARDELGRAQRRADSTRAPPAARAGLALVRADLAVQLNELSEAQRLYARAEALYRLAANAGGEASAQEGRAWLLLAQDDPVRAQALLEAALRTQLGAGEQRSAALTRISLGQALVARGDTTAARRQLVRATTELERAGDPVAAAAAVGERAKLEMSAGRVVTADSLYRAAIARLGDRAAPVVVWRLHAGRAVVLRAQGAVDSAARELRHALDVLSGPRRSLALAERRRAFLADKWDVYAQLAFVERDRGRPGAAFGASEGMRAREMMEQLARGRVAPPSGAPELVAREQDLRRQIAELTSEQERGSRGADELREPELEGRERASREALARAQQSYADLLLEMREAAPRHAALVTAEAPDWREVARHLAADAAFIEYLVSDSGALAFVITTDTLALIDLGTRRRDVARLVEFTRGTIERRGAGGSGDTDSLCQTGLGSGALADVPAGDEWVGLTRACLHAGAGHVIATLWLVDDWATAALMERFYGVRTAIADPAHALAIAQRAMLATPATGHPFFWAGFVLAEGAR